MCQGHSLTPKTDPLQSNFEDPRDFSIETIVNLILHAKFVRVKNITDFPRVGMFQE